MKLSKILLLAATFALASCGGASTTSEPTSASEDSSPSVTSEEETSLDPTSEEATSEEPSIEEQCDEPFYHLNMKKNPTETENGFEEYQCAVCGHIECKVLPKLSSSDYQVENLVANCAHGNGHRYVSEQYGTYEVTDNERTEHTVYGDYCDECHQLVGEFKFENFTAFNAEGYPRLYQLSDYWDNAWLLGGDNGTIVVRRSSNQGASWTSPQVVSNLPDYACANVDFFELGNHDIICSYRAIGRSNAPGLIQYNRKLHFALSHDGGQTWVDGGDIVDNFKLAEQYGLTQNDAVTAMLQHGGIGFYEPYVDLINNVPTVMYADDFTSMLLKPLGPSVSRNYCSQYLMSQTYDMEAEEWSTERVAIMDGTTKKSPTGSGLEPRISRDGMPVFARMHNGTYVVVFEGTYRDTSYYSETGGKMLTEYHPFEILMSYSYDGITWANPVEIYTPHNNGSKSSAPFVCVTEDDRLIVSFQTDEDAVPLYVGDAVSVMKCMISKPGVAIEDITQESFYSVTNVNNTPVGAGSLWNGMMLIGNKLYTCSSGCKVRVSDIPVYADPADYDVDPGQGEDDSSSEQGEQIRIEGVATPITLEGTTFDAYSSNAYHPNYTNDGVMLDNTTHCEQKLILKDFEVGDTYQIDFKLVSESNRDVNTGFYLNARNPGNDLDKITALDIHLERSVASLNWSVHLYNFNQGYAGQLGTAANKLSKEYSINVRVIVEEGNIRVLIDDMSTVVYEYNVGTSYDLSGVLGIRNQGMSKAFISDLVITRPAE